MRSTHLTSLLVFALLVSCSKEKVCPADQRLCGETCVAVATDPANCGGCGEAFRCATGEVCADSHCLCADGRVDCGAASGCVDITSDPDHCGSCTAACSAPDVCTTTPGGSTGCASACASASQTSCDRACVDLSGDAFNCGACGRPCGTREHCQNGLCLADLYLACFNSGEVREASRALEPSGIPLTTDSGPVRMTWLGNRIYVANGPSNTISEVRFDPPAVRATSGQTSIKIPSAGWSDLEFITSHGDLLYVSDAAVGQIVVVDPATGAIIDERPLAASQTEAPNPQGIVFVTGASAATEKAYVALNGTNQVAVLDVSLEASCQGAGAAPPPCGGGPACSAGKVCVSDVCQPCSQILSRIDVQPLASPNGQAQPSRMISHGSRLFVTLWNLDTSGTIWKPAGSGRLAVIDTTLDQLDPAVVGQGPSGPVSGLVDLGTDCADPGDLAVLGDTLYVTCGAFGTTGIVGAGIVPVDLSGSTPKVNAIVPVEAGEAPGRLAFCGSVGYVGDRNSGKVLLFDPATGQVTQRAALCPMANGYAYVADVACGP